MVSKANVVYTVTCERCVHCHLDGVEDRCWGILPTLVGDMWLRNAPTDRSWPICASFKPKLDS